MALPWFTDRRAPYRYGKVARAKSESSEGFTPELDLFVPYAGELEAGMHLVRLASVEKLRRRDVQRVDFELGRYHSSKDGVHPRACDAEGRLVLGVVPTLDWLGFGPHPTRGRSRRCTHCGK